MGNVNRFIGFAALVFPLITSGQVRDLNSALPGSNLDLPNLQEAYDIEKELNRDFLEPDFSLSRSQSEVLRRYSHLDPKRRVPSALLRRAVLYFDKNKRSFRNQNYITIVDFSKRSNKRRLFLVHMPSGAVSRLRTAHGAGGDRDNDGFVEALSNTSGSHMSSRGFYRVAEVYHGSWGRSVRLDGLSSTNSRARRRAIVIHGHNDMTESNRIQPLSWGCFMLSHSIRDAVIDRISGGSLLYADRSSNY